MEILTLENFSDLFFKEILEDGSIDSGILLFNRPYTFSISGVYSSATLNTFQHTWDYSIFPVSLSSVTASNLYASSANSFSGYYYTTGMQLYNFKQLQNFGNLFSTTTVTSSVSATTFNSGKFNPNFSNGDTTLYTTFTASVTGFYLYSFDRRTYGDKIYDGSVSMYSQGVLVAYDGTKNKNSNVYSLTSSIYSDSTTGITRFWVLPDFGKIAVWSSDPNNMNALTGIDKILFRNSVGIPNTTINLYIDPSEYNLSENFSFYLTDFTTGRLPNPFITTIGLYNPWNDLLAVCKFQKPIRKGNIPITTKMVLDIL